MAPWDLVYKTWLGENAYNLIPGLRKLAEASGLKLGQTPNAAEIQRLYQLWGSETAFIEGAPAVAAALKLDGSTVPDEEILDLLQNTETLYELPIRSVRGKLMGGFKNRRFTVIVSAGTANWTKRRVRLLRDYWQGENFGIDRVFALASDRPCTLGTEVNNQVVKLLGGSLGLGRVPTETDVLLTYLAAAELDFELFTGKLLEDQFAALLAAYPDIAQGDVLMLTNANATYVALAGRRFIKEEAPTFDRNPRKPQFFFTQDEFELARTSEQAADTDNYQRPLTVFSGLVRLVNELFQLKA